MLQQNPELQSSQIVDWTAATRGYAGARSQAGWEAGLVTRVPNKSAYQMVNHSSHYSGQISESSRVGGLDTSWCLHGPNIGFPHHSGLVGGWVPSAATAPVLAGSGANVGWLTTQHPPGRSDGLMVRSKMASSSYHFESTNNVNRY